MSVTSDFRENKNNTKQWYPNLQVSCFTKVCCRVAVVSGMAMEACGLSFFESLGTHSPAFGQSAYRVLGSHRRAVLAQTTDPRFSGPSPFNRPSTVQAVLLRLYLRWILSERIVPQRGQQCFLAGIALWETPRESENQVRPAGRQGSLVFPLPYRHRSCIPKGIMWNLCSYQILINPIVLLYSLNSSMGLISGLHLHFSVDQKCTFEADLLIHLLWFDSHSGAAF